MVDRGQRDEAASARTLRRADQVLRGQHPQRLAHGAATDPELPCQHGLVRQPLPAGQLAADDQIPQLVVNLLVGLLDAMNRGVLGVDLDVSGVCHSASREREHNPGTYAPQRMASRSSGAGR